MGIIEATVARDFPTDEIGLFERFVRSRELDFGHEESFIVAIELVDLERMLAATNQIAGLIDDARLTEAEQLLSLIRRNFLLELVAAETSVERRPLDGQETTTAAETDPYGASVSAGNVALSDPIVRVSLCLEVEAFLQQELPLDFHAAHAVQATI